MVLREKGPTLVGVLWMETVICLIVLGLRVYTRVRILRNPGWDDLLLVITWVRWRHSLLRTFSSDANPV